jgi:flagellar hook-length control protein FliK
MSVGSLSQQNAKALDLFAPKQAPAEPRPRAERTADAESGDGGFKQALRESSSQRESREVEAAQPRDKSERVEGEATPTDDSKDKSNAVDDKPGAQGKEQDAETSEKAGQSKEESSKADAPQGDEQQAEQARADAAANAEAQAAAQLQAPQQAGNQNTTKQASSDADAEAASSNAKQHAQAAAQQAAQASQAQSPSQQNATQTEAAVATTAQPIAQQGTTSDAGDDAPRQDSASVSQLNASAKAAGNAAAATATFTLPDQPASEARLNINPTANATQADAAKALQTQPVMQQEDADAVNTARLSRGLANAVQQRGGAVTLRLTPPEMGTVRIQMQITGTNVSASFHAESASAQTLLSQQLGQLRTALETQGMNVDKLSVQPLASASQTSSANQSQNNNPNDNAQQQNQAQNQSANDGRSRGQYSGSSDQRGQDPDTPTQQHQARRGFSDQLEDAAQPAA